MAACSNSILLPNRHPWSILAMRPITALALAAGCVAHAARVAFFGERPSPPRRLSLLMAQRAFLVERVNKLSDLTDGMGYAEAVRCTEENIEPIEQRIDHLDEQLLDLPPFDLVDAALKVRHLVELHKRYSGVLPETVMQAFLAAFEGKDVSA